MLLQPADDAAGTFVLLPAWPCEWDVSFVLWAPLATRVQLVFAGGRVQSIDVQPPARAIAVVWANCVVAADLARLPGRLMASI